MKRFLPLLVIPVLLLVGPARADDTDDVLEAEIADIEAQIQVVSEKARAASDDEEAKLLAVQVRGLHEQMVELQAKKEKRRRIRQQIEEANLVYQRTREHHAALQAKYDELQERRLRLSEQFTDAHPKMIEVGSEIEHVAEKIALLEQARRFFDLSESRRQAHQFVEAREAIEKALKLARQVRVVAETRVELTTDESGRWQFPPVPPVPLVPPTPPGSRPAQDRIDHLRAAARHLHEAGAHEPAKEIEREIRSLERARSGEPAVRAAIEELTQEVRDLRREVRELRDLLIENEGR